MNDKELHDKLTNKGYRLSNFYKIIDTRARLRTFRPNETQKRHLANRTRREIILKARQLGMTTLACVDMLDNCLFNDNYRAVIIAHKEEAMKGIFSKIKLAWENFPDFVKEFFELKDIQCSANAITFNNGSSISVALSSRGDTVNHLHISEFGKMCKQFPIRAEEVILGAIPSVPDGGRITIESTAEGEEGYFHNMFWEGWEKENLHESEFTSFFYPWTLDKRYETKGEFKLTNKLEKYKEKHSLSTEKINWYFLKEKILKVNMKQEFPTTPEEAFWSSGVKLFNHEILANYKTRDIEAVGGWKIYKDYKVGHTYALGADVAEGVGQDSSTICIMDFSTLKPEVVATYANNDISADLFAYEIKNGGVRYGNCLVAPERNNHGHSTITKLKEIYNNIFTMENKDKYTDTDSRKLGWNTNIATKPKMFNELKTAVNDELIEIISDDLKTEMRTYDKGDLSQIRFDENQTKHFDILVATCIVFQMKDYIYKKKPRQRGGYNVATYQ